MRSRGRMLEGGRFSGHLTKGQGSRDNATLMQVMRQIMRDRMLAGALALVFGYLLLLQAAVGDYSRSMMAAALLTDQGTLCTAHGPQGPAAHEDQAAVTGAGQSDHETDHGRLLPDCCGTLCRLAANLSVALLASPAAGSPTLVAPPDEPVFTRAADARPQPLLRGLSGAARAPPILI